MITGININERMPFDIDGTIFILKPIKQKDKMLLSHRIKDAQDKKDNFGIIDSMIIALTKGVHEIKNIKIGEEVKTITEINEDTLEMLPIDIQQKLFEEIIKINTPQEKEIKN